MLTTEPKAIIVMKVGPHSNMTLTEIVKSKQQEELIHGVHYWGYSGSFCQPRPTQEFCRWAKKQYGVDPSIILIETKSSYKSTIGHIKHYSTDNKVYTPFAAPVQLQGAQFSFVAKNIRPLETFCPAAYSVYGGKNNGKKLTEHLRFRVNKSFATLNESVLMDDVEATHMNVLIGTLVEPYAIWLME